MNISVAIVGCGAVARGIWIPAILKNPNVKLSALIDVNLDVIHNLKKEFGLDKVSEYSDIQDINECDAAIILAPPHLHAKFTVALLKKGVHVLCEKPMATSVADAKAMMKEAEQNNKILLIGMTKWYCPNSYIMNDMLRDNFLGTIRYYELVSCTRTQWNAANPMRYDPKFVLGGVVFENGVHWIYRILEWFGMPEIKKYEDDRIDGVEANARITCTHKKNGASFEGKMIFSADHVRNNRLLIKGSKKTIEVRENDEQAVYVHEVINGKRYVARVEGEKPANLFEIQLNDFVNAILTEHAVKVSLEHAVQTIEFLERAYSIRTKLEQPWAV